MHMERVVRNRTMEQGTIGTLVQAGSRDAILVWREEADRKELAA
jgi:hypothetical protein